MELYRRYECRLCYAQRRKNYVENNKEKVQELGRAWREQNAPRKKEAARKWYEENKDRQNAVAREKYAANKEEYRERIKKWKQANKNKVCTINTNRRAAKATAIPPWADRSEINRIYAEAKARGPSYHVDHIVPLRHPLVSGLHCEANLQILTAEDNLRKSNSYWPDMP